VRDLLFLPHRIPYPPNKGDKTRAWHFFRHLAERRRVHLGCFIDDEHDWTHVPRLKAFGGETYFAKIDRRRALLRSVPALLTSAPLTLPYYYDASLADWVRRLRRDRSPTVFVYSSSMAQYVMGDSNAPRIIDFVDVDSAKWHEYSRRTHWPMAAVYRREAATLLAAERRIAQQFDASILVSDTEADLLRHRAPESARRIFAISMGVDLEQFSVNEPHPDPYGGAGASALCFTGMMNYWPNIDAVTWFARSVFPRLRVIRPTATFWIVGAHPARAVRNLAEQPGVVVTGRVADTRPYLAHAGVVVAPLRVARGIQTKVLEAMAMGRPVVASHDAFDGLRVQPGRDLLVARSADEFVEEIQGLWVGDAGAALGSRARNAVELHYRWPQQLAALDAIIDAVEQAAAGRVPSGALAAEH
jgi:sugar transferase (PEP-CTERM/EpsH1 system associated)